MEKTSRARRAPSLGVAGVGVLRLVCERAPEWVATPSPVEAPRMGAPDAVAAFMRPLVDAELQERFYVLPLNAKHKVVGAPIVISSGLANTALVHPREVFRAAIVAGAIAVIVCHNHPSGDPKPSPEDRVVTRSLVDAGKLLDIPVLDHLILGAGTSDYYSFAENGAI